MKQLEFSLYIQPAKKNIGEVLPKKITQIRIFKKFVDKFDINYYNDHQYTIYAILTPRAIYHEKQNEINHMVVDILIMQKHTSMSYTPSFYTETVSLSALPLITIGDFIDNAGYLRTREINRPNAYKIIYNQKIFIENPRSVENIITIDQDPILTEIYSHYMSFGDNCLNFEYFLKYKDDGKTIYIPMIEVLSYFYIGTTSSTAKYIFSAIGLQSLYSSSVFDEESEKYYIDLSKEIAWKDRYHIAYFAINPEYSKMYSNVYINSLVSPGLITQIPSNQPIQMNVRILNYKDNYLVLKINDTDHIRNALQGKQFSFYHDKQKREMVGQSDFDEKDFYRRKSKIENELNTDEAVDRMLDSEISQLNPEIVEWDVNVIEDVRTTNIKNTNYTKKQLSEENPASLSTNLAINGEGSAALELTDDRLKIQDASPIYMDDLILEFENRGFNIVERDETFMDPQNRAQAFVDQSQTIRRAYKILKIWNDEISFFILDAQHKEYEDLFGNTTLQRPRLLIFPNYDEIDFENDISKILVQNIIENSSSWFSRRQKRSSIDAIYSYKDRTACIKHSRFPDKFADNILREVRRF